MEKFIFFDVETTGLPTSFHISPERVEHWPHIVQIAWIITDLEGKELEHKSYIIKPNGWEIPTSASRIHKITQKKAEKEGVDAEAVLKEFESLLNDDISYLIAHNIEFDLNVLQAEFYRYNLDVEKLKGVKEFCTMKKFTDFCQIEKRGMIDYKWPTLEELHKKALGTPMIKKHDAVADVYATMLCFFAVHKTGYFSILTKEDIEAEEERKKKIKEEEVENQKFIGDCIFMILVVIFVAFIFYLIS